jgi:hypothetical protein
VVRPGRGWYVDYFCWLVSLADCGLPAGCEEALVDCDGDWLLEVDADDEGDWLLALGADDAGDWLEVDAELLPAPFEALYASSAACVRGPMMPSIGPGSNPACFSICCCWRTDSSPCCEELPLALADWLEAALCDLAEGWVLLALCDEAG